MRPGPIPEVRPCPHLRARPGHAEGGRGLDGHATLALGTSPRSARFLPRWPQGAARMTPLDPRTDLVLERVVDVAPELVWKAWTTPEYLKQWFTPAPWKSVGCEID